MTWPAPTPSTPPPPKASEWPTPLVLVASLAVVAGYWLVTGALDNNGDDDDGGRRPKYKWSDAVCTIDGLSGRFTNRADDEFNGKLWAEAKVDGKVVARDEETIFGLAPGASEVVEFVWVLDDVDTCGLVDVEWSY